MTIHKQTEYWGAASQLLFAKTWHIPISHILIPHMCQFFHLQGSCSHEWRYFSRLYIIIQTTASHSVPKPGMSRPVTPNHSVPKPGMSRSIMYRSHTYSSVSLFRWRREVCDEEFHKILKGSPLQQTSTHQPAWLEWWVSEVLSDLPSAKHGSHSLLQRSFLQW